MPTRPENYAGALLLDPGRPVDAVHIASAEDTHVRRFDLKK